MQIFSVFVFCINHMAMWSLFSS